MPWGHLVPAVSPLNVTTCRRVHELRRTATPPRFVCDTVAEQTPVFLAETFRKRPLRRPEEETDADNQRVPSRAAEDAIFTSLPVSAGQRRTAHVRVFLKKQHIKIVQGYFTQVLLCSATFYRVQT